MREGVNKVVVYGLVHRQQSESAFNFSKTSAKVDAKNSGWVILQREMQRENSFIYRKMPDVYEKSFIFYLRQTRSVYHVGEWQWKVGIQFFHYGCKLFSFFSFHCHKDCIKHFFFPRFCTLHLYGPLHCLRPVLSASLSTLSSVLDSYCARRRSGLRPVMRCHF